MRGLAQDNDNRSRFNYALSDRPTDGGDRGRDLEFLQYAATVGHRGLELNFQGCRYGFGAVSISHKA